MLFQCPLPASLGAITATDCPIKFDQIQKLAFRRKSGTAVFTTEKPITTQASWTPSLTASDNTKIVITPFLTGLEFPASEARKDGGNDNTTLNGIAELKGGSSITVPFIIKNISAETAKGLRALCAETQIQPGATNLEAYFLATDNNVIFDGGADGDTVQGFSIYNLYVPDVASAGFGAANVYNCSFELAFGWSENFKMAKADFDPRSL